MELVIIREDSPTWIDMWGWLEKHPLNEGLAEPMVATNEDNGEVWQYMGSFRNADALYTIHEFRHRSHPIDGERKYLKYSNSVPEADIEIIHKIK